MQKYRLNKEQRKILSDYLNNLSIAWFSAGVISAFFIKTDDIFDLIIRATGSIFISTVLFILGIKNLETK